MLGRFLVFLGGTLVAVLFLALLAPLFVDWTDFRSDFELEASRILGKKVVVNGDVEARILPFPSVTMHDVTVGRGEGGEPLVRVASFSMDAELAPFLSGEARIFDMRIDAPKARLRLLSDGKLEWLRGSSPQIPARTVVLERVSISGGEIEFIDEQTGRTRIARNLDAQLSARGLGGPWSINGRGEFDGETASFSVLTQPPASAGGAIPIRTSLKPDDRPFEIRLEGNLAASEGRPYYGGRFEIAWTAPPPGANGQRQQGSAPTVRGEFSLTNERIRVPSYRLELGDSENPYAVTGEATLDAGAAPEFLLTAEGQQIDVNRIGNEGAQGKTGRNPALSARQRLLGLLDRAAQIPIPNLPGKATLRLPALVAGDTIVRDIQLDVRPQGNAWTIEKAVATLPGRTQVEAEGLLTLAASAPSFSGSMLVASTQPSGLSAWLAGPVDQTIRQLPSLGFSAKVDLAPDLQRFEALELAIGTATLKGRIERQAPLDAPANLSFDLAGNALDLDALKAVYSLVSGEEGGESLLSNQIAGRLKVDRFSVGEISAQGLNTVFSYGEAGIKLDTLEIADLGGAAITASGRAGGSLLDYSGEGTATLKSADPRGLLEILQQRLPSHPLIDRLAANADWYTDSTLSAGITFGDAGGNGRGEGFSARIGGTVHGSRIEATVRAEELDDLLAPVGTTLDMTVENEDPVVLFGQAGFNPLPLPADGPGRLTVKIADMDAERASTSLTLQAGDSEAKLEGDVSLRAADFLAGRLRADVTSPDLDPYLVMNGLSLPPMLEGLPVKGGADLEIAADKVTISGLDATMAGNPVSGALTVSRTDPTPKATGTLSMGSADLDWLAETVFGMLRDPDTGELGTETLPAPPIADVDLDVALKVERFSPGLFGDIDGFSTKLSLNDGAMTLDEMKGQWIGGTMAGRLAMTNSNATGFTQLKVDITEGELTRLFDGYGGGAAPSGRFNFSLVGEGSGRTVNELAYSLNGSGAAALSGISVPNFDLALLPPLLDRLDAEDVQAGSATGIDGALVSSLVEPLLARGPLVLERIDVPFNVTDGTVRVQNLMVPVGAPQPDTAQVDGRADTAVPSIAVNGRIDIRAKTIDASGRVALDAGTQALAGTEPALGIAYRGPIQAPERVIDVGELTNFLSQRAFERERRRVETLQSNVLEKQRLRREAALYREAEAERARAAELEAARQLEEQRLKQAARERAERQRQAEERAAAERDAAAREAERAAAAARDAQTGAQGTTAPAERGAQPVPEPERVIRGEELPTLRFDELPGVE